MKIAIIGFSGSGKSTLAHAISKKHSLPLLHLDRAHWLPNWVERDKGEREEIVKDFLDANSSWVIDGNYAKVFYERRLCEADTIIIMRFGALACLFACLTSHTTADHIASDVNVFDLNALFCKYCLGFCKRSCGVAVVLGASVNNKYFHILLLSSLVGQVNYLLSSIARRALHPSNISL
jgi:hypothetical protein